MAAYCIMGNPAVESLGGPLCNRSFCAVVGLQARTKMDSPFKSFRALYREYKEQERSGTWKGEVIRRHRAATAIQKVWRGFASRNACSHYLRIMNPSTYLPCPHDCCYCNKIFNNWGVSNQDEILVLREALLEKYHIDQKMSGGFSAIHVVIASKSGILIERVLALNPDLRTQQCDGCTAFHLGNFASFFYIGMHIIHESVPLSSCLALFSCDEIGYGVPEHAAEFTPRGVPAFPLRQQRQYASSFCRCSGE